MRIQGHGYMKGSYIDTIFPAWILRSFIGKGRRVELETKTLVMSTNLGSLG